MVFYYTYKYIYFFLKKNEIKIITFVCKIVNGKKRDTFGCGTTVKDCNPRDMFTGLAEYLFVFFFSKKKLNFLFEFFLLSLVSLQRIKKEFGNKFVRFGNPDTSLNNPQSCKNFYFDLVDFFFKKKTYIFFSKKDLTIPQSILAQHESSMDELTISMWIRPSSISLTEDSKYHFFFDFSIFFKKFAGQLESFVIKVLRMIIISNLDF